MEKYVPKRFVRTLLFSHEKSKDEMHFFEMRCRIGGDITINLK